MQNEGSGIRESWHEKKQARFLQEKSRERLLERVERLEKSVHLLCIAVAVLALNAIVMMAVSFLLHPKAEPIRPTADAALVAAHYSRRVP